ncbi:hypothetical protein swp_0899 [Shewanella piezotolerans WP3]|uniref:Uncharacterized protein n=1 Tax=Shewanella piezotolerans (strain WP3 / JCM 13877) TaxID=225849 RepID=B8CK03_SHEPW|nr:hypothetical protein swp_0899 [Shewanella piezotolerans WP3]
MHKASTFTAMRLLLQQLYGAFLSLNSMSSSQTAINALVFVTKLGKVSTAITSLQRFGKDSYVQSTQNQQKMLLQYESNNKYK